MCGEGDHFGEPVKLQTFQKLFLCMLFEKRPDGRRRYRRALLEVPKGCGKTSLSAWIGAYQLATQFSAVIPVAAASYDQAELLFGDMRTTVRESPTLSDYAALRDAAAHGGVGQPGGTTTGCAWRLSSLSSVLWSRSVRTWFSGKLVTPSFCRHYEPLSHRSTVRVFGFRQDRAEGC